MLTIESNKIRASREDTHPRFSIVLPVRNGGALVKECVNSILQQSCRDFHLLILENCSTDGTSEWLHSLNDDRIKIFPADRPLSLERNWSRIADIEKNEFLTFIGHDDVLDPDYLEVMSALIKRHPQATLYQTHFRFIDAAGHFLRHCLPMCEVQQVHEFVAKQFMRTMDSMGSGYMMRSKDFAAVGGFTQYPNLIFGDYELWVRLAAKGQIAIDHCECFSYREHPSSSVGTRVAEYQRSLFQYLIFLDNEAQRTPKLKEVIRRYSANYMDYMCESLIYRGIMAKDAVDGRRASDIVKDFSLFGHSVVSLDGNSGPKALRIRMAVLIDSWLIGHIALRLASRAKRIVVSVCKRN